LGYSKFRRTKNRANLIAFSISGTKSKLIYRIKKIIMNVPKIVFRYSWIYDQNCKEWARISKKDIKSYPSSRKIVNYIKSVEKMWNKISGKILHELSKVTSLKWKSKIIHCYVVGKCVPFSDPLTLPLYEKKDYFIDVLIHELIHQLFSQNWKETRKAWKYIQRKYKNESHETQIHIPLHAVHSHIYMKFFNVERLERDFKAVSKIPDYRKSWEIVKRKGYEKIMQEFVRRI